MQVKDLYSEVAKLGFDTLLEDETAFYQTVNRALLQVACDFPQKKSLTIRHTPQKNLLECKPCEIYTKPTVGDFISGYAERARTYYFECDGDGYAYIETENKALGTIELNSNGEYKAYRGVIRDGASFVDAAIRLRFAGGYSYHITNLALYGELSSESAEDVQAFGDFVTYDLNKLTDDFLSFASPLIEREGIPLKDGYETTEDHFLLISRKKEGIYRVKYNKRPKRISKSGTTTQDQTPLDISLAAEESLALLVASYLWLDDESELARYYRALYQENVTRYKKDQRNIDPVPYITNGW